MVSKPNLPWAAFFVGLCVLSLRLPAVMAADKIPALATIPDSLPDEARMEFTQRKQLLEADLSKLKAAANAFNAKSADNQSDDEYNAVKALQAKYVEAASAFNQDLATAEAAAAKPKSTPAAFDSRTLITKDEYDDAIRKETDLLKRQQRLQTELGKLKGWQQGLQADSDEFAKIRTSAQIDYLHDVLMNIPASDTFDIFAKAKYITPEEAGALSAGYDALKGLVSGTEGIDINDSQKQLEKILGAQKNLRDAMLDQAMAKLKYSELAGDQASYHWLENVGKTFDAAKDMILFSQQKDHFPEASAQLVVKLCTNAVPLANFVVIGDTLFEKKLAQSIVQKPLDSLNAAMSKEFSAQRFLNEKLDSVNCDLAAVQETVKNYQAVHSPYSSASPPH